jgi:uncharacterized protein YbcI
MTMSEGIDVAAVREEIAREILRLHQEAYGTGAQNVQVHVADDLVLVVIDVELSTAEETLLGAGRGDAVKATRETFQMAVSPTFKAIAERATGRTVVSFISHMNVDPPFAVELFRFKPRK